MLGRKWIHLQRVKETLRRKTMETPMQNTSEEWKMPKCGQVREKTLVRWGSVTDMQLLTQPRQLPGACLLGKLKAK